MFSPCAPAAATGAAARGAVWALIPTLLNVAAASHSNPAAHATPLFMLAPSMSNGDWAGLASARARANGLQREHVDARLAGDPIEQTARFGLLSALQLPGEMLRADQPHRLAAERLGRSILEGVGVGHFI